MYGFVEPPGPRGGDATDVTEKIEVDDEAKSRSPGKASPLTLS